MSSVGQICNLCIFVSLVIGLNWLQTCRSTLVDRLRQLRDLYFRKSKARMICCCFTVLEMSTTRGNVEMQILRMFFVCSCCLTSMLIAGAAHAQSASAKVDFNRDIRPILSENCYQCHGPDKNQREAELRLDVKDGLFANRGEKPSEKYAIVAAGQPAKSALFNRITTTDKDEHMPPADSGRALTNREIELIQRWIEQGADYQGHWAYLKPTPTKPPADADTKLVANDVDRFVLAKLKERGLPPSGRAGKATLIRRLSFDLVGLPPTSAQVDEFVNDDSPQAYEKLVDRLLASPHFGERMAMYWLDLVRYADTNGIHGDNHRDVAPFRDYVINAFNNNKPFDQFTIEQLAGDLLPQPTIETKVASGYNKLLMTTREGGAQAKEYTAKYAADRVRNASSVWMGATMGCSECHDHKYDPYKTKDFYSFAAFFADVKETAVGTQSEKLAVPTEEHQNRLKQIEQSLAALKKQFETPTPQLQADQATWEQATRAELAAESAGWIATKPEKLESKGGATLRLQDDLSVLATGKNPPTEIYSAALNTDLEKVTGIRLEALAHPSLAAKSLSRANGNFVLTEFEVEVVSLDNPKPQPVKIAAAVADFSQKDFPVANAIDEKPNTGWAVAGHVKKVPKRQAVFTFAKPIAGGLGTTLHVRLKHESMFKNHNIGRFRLSLTTAKKPSLKAGGLPTDIVKALQADPAKQTLAEKVQLTKHFRDTAPEFAALRKQIADTQKQQADTVKAAPTTLISMSIKPRTMRVLPRGNWLDDSGEIVSPAVPAFLPQLKAKDRANRLDLANWMVDKNNPLVARVFVNRLWKLMFGRGIVSTLDDFGSQGKWPTHPRLLDWLALEFVESGWDVKHMLKLMAMSATYQQTSNDGAELRNKDPYNNWLARQGRFRLDAEMVRDNALSVSGLLVKTIGGRSVKPYQPLGYWAHLNFPKRVYQPDTGENQYRRGLYTYWARTFLHPSLLAFDATTREECTVERPRSNTPLQALVLLNDPTYVESARALAERIIHAGGKDANQRIEFAYREALSRKPRPQELALLTSLQQQHLEQYQADPDAAKAFNSVGLRAVPAGVDAAELASWTSVARVILNLHETITRY